MYEPAPFRDDDLAGQHDFVRAHPLGLLISSGPDGVLADPVPFLLAAEGAKGVLRCHVSRANDQWRVLQESPSTLVVFQGVDTYITPSWYPSKAATGKVVPTWNYAIVQVRGQARVIDDTEWLRANVTGLTETHEAGRQPPWRVSDAPEAFVAAQLRAIVGIEIPIDDIAAKFKASQNLTAADRAGVIDGLAAAGDARSLAMCDLVRERDRG